MVKKRNNEVSMSIDKSDITRLDGKIDAIQERLLTGQEKLNDCLQTLTREVTRLATIVETFPRPEARPCQFFRTHEAEHIKCNSPTGLRSEFDSHVVEHHSNPAPTKAEFDAHIQDHKERGIIWYGAIVSFIFNFLFIAATAYLHLKH